MYVLRYMLSGVLWIWVHWQFIQSSVELTSQLTENEVCFVSNWFLLISEPVAVGLGKVSL